MRLGPRRDSPAGGGCTSSSTEPRQSDRGSTPRRFAVDRIRTPPARRFTESLVSASRRPFRRLVALTYGIVVPFLSAHAVRATPLHTASFRDPDLGSRLRAETSDIEAVRHRSSTRAAVFRPSCERSAEFLRGGRMSRSTSQFRHPDNAN